MTLPIDFDETTRLREENRELREALEEAQHQIHYLRTHLNDKWRAYTAPTTEKTLAQIKAALTN